MGDLEELIRRWFALNNACDFDGLRAMYGPNSVYERANGSSLGADEIVAYLRGLKSSFPDHSADVNDILVSENAVIVEWTETGSHTIPYDTGATGVIAPSGKSFSAKIVDIFRFDAEIIASQREYFDRLGLLTDLGWIETSYRTGSD
jgi:steroid delta-isomerase-like uncharacterized protein